MGQLFKYYTFAAGSPAVAEHINANFDQITSKLNGNLDQTNLAGKQTRWRVQFYFDGQCPSAASSDDGRFIFTVPDITLHDSSAAGNGVALNWKIKEIGLAFTSTTSGTPAGGVRVELYRLPAGNWSFCQYASTYNNMSDGHGGGPDYNANDFVPAVTPNSIQTSFDANSSLKPSFLAYTAPDPVITTDHLVAGDQYMLLLNNDIVTNSDTHGELGSFQYDDPTNASDLTIWVETEAQLFGRHTG